MRKQVVKTVVNWFRGVVTRLTKPAQIHGVVQADHDYLFYTDCQKFLQKLHEAPEKELKHSVLLKRMHTDAKNFRDIVDMLTLEGDIEIVTIPNPTGRAKRSYRLTKGGIEHAGRKA